MDNKFILKNGNFDYDLMKEHTAAEVINEMNDYYIIEEFGINEEATQLMELDIEEEGQTDEYFDECKEEILNNYEKVETIDGFIYIGNE